MKKSILALVVAFLAFPGRAPAWGGYGHEVIAIIAQAHLQPQAVAAINQLRLADPVGSAQALAVGGKGRYGQKDQRRLVQFLSQKPLDLALIASWMDAWRGHHHETGAYHYINSSRRPRAGRWGWSSRNLAVTLPMMGDKIGIQWTDATWNPVTGCTKVSPGCEHYQGRPAVVSQQED